jgi:SAM-dependent methyltransferase
MNNPAYDYDANRPQYSTVRRPDPFIAAFIRDAMGVVKTVLNVGAGAGSYEPEDLQVTAIEPSAAMRESRLKLGRIPAIAASAESLPFDDNSFDVAMGCLTIHHWPDVAGGIREVRRVTRGKLLFMTFDPDGLGAFWNQDYFPELVAIERERYPDFDTLKACLPEDEFLTRPIPVPLLCTDGFQEAFYGRPEAFLDPVVRKSQSAWGFIDATTETSYVEALRADLESGDWERRYGHLRTQPHLMCGLSLVEFRPRA